MSEPTSGWTAIPIWLIRDTDLTPNELVVLLVLMSRVNASGECWPSQKTIARESRQSLRTTQRTLDSLRTKGFVSWKKRVTEGGDLTSSLYRTHVENPLGSRQADTTPRQADVTVTSESRDRHVTVAEELDPVDLDPTPTTGAGDHPHEPNARRALAALATGVETDELLSIAYPAGNGDPWDGYLRIKTECESLNAPGIRNRSAVLRKRLNVPKVAAR